LTHCEGGFDFVSSLPSPIYAGSSGEIGSIRLASLFLTLPTGGLTRQHVNSCESGAAGHSITSSARSSMLGGTVRLSALAVLRLMISEYFVGY